MKLSLYLTTPGSRFWAAQSPLAMPEAIALAARLGYDGVEVMPRDAGDPDPAELRALTARQGIEVVAIATGYIAVEHGLTFSDPDPLVRRRATDAVRSCVDAARLAEAPVVSVGVVRGKLRGDVTREEALSWLAACLCDCGHHAAAQGVRLAVEPVNRYEAGLVHTVEEALDLVESVGLPSVGIQVDTFHMNIEERSPAEAVLRAGPHLAHVHFADSNRRAPGWGHVDFGPIASALREAGYAGAVGIEIDLDPDVESAARAGLEFARRILEGS